VAHKEGQLSYLLFPDLNVLYAGGLGYLRDSIGRLAVGPSYAKRIFLSNGLSPDHLPIDDRFRNTSENVRLSFELALPEIGETGVKYPG